MDTRSIFTGARKRLSEYFLSEEGSVNSRSALTGGAILTTSAAGVLLGSADTAYAHNCPGAQIPCHADIWKWCCDTDTPVCGFTEGECFAP